VISKIEIGNEAQPTEQPTEVQNVKETRTLIREKYQTNTKRVQFADSLTTNQCSVTNFIELTTNQYGNLMNITGSVSAACCITARVIVCQRSLVVLTVLTQNYHQMLHKDKNNQGVYTILMLLRLRSF
jgi:hypothetical protein